MNTAQNPAQPEARLAAHRQRASRHRVYLSGPITSIGAEQAALHFGNIEQKLRRQGFRALNPMRIGLSVWLGSRGYYAACLVFDILWLWLRGCTAICMLNGWKQSPGALAEKAFAEAIGLEVMFETDLFLKQTSYERND